MNRKLQSDCEHCFGLCCVALPYAKSADFAFHKEGGVPCRNLGPDHRCSIHELLIGQGFHGCVTYECFGAGQYISQELFEGNDWRKNPELSREMFAVFPIVQQLHEMLYYLYQALDLEGSRTIKNELQSVSEMTTSLTHLNPEDILKLDISAHRETVNHLLLKTSKLVRNDCVQDNKNDMMRKDFIGANLQGANLRGMNLRGTLLIASNLKKADLRKVDFIGADLRDADLSGADLTGCIFLTQAQVNSAKGNIDTKIPGYLKVPEHWLNHKG